MFKKCLIDLHERSVLKLVKWNKSCRYIFLTAKLVQGEFEWPCKAFDLYLHVSRELFPVSHVCVYFFWHCMLSSVVLALFFFCGSVIYTDTPCVHVQYMKHIGKRYVISGLIKKLYYACSSLGGVFISSFNIP